ncbi:MAG: PaaI family thioesterase [Desulfuromonadales bacterium]|nr:PaaI family thioesterase [Desulfuromonadales bacterium]
MTEPALVKDNACFVCGPANGRGLQAQFELDPAARAAWSRLTLPDWTQGWQGVVHGGILSTLLDEVSVHAGRTVGPHPVTAELTVRFRKPVAVGSTIEVRGEVVEVRRRLLQVRSWLAIAGETYVEAEARVMLVRLPID